MVKISAKNGFTIVELLIVMAILGILMGLGWRGLAVLKREYTLQTSAENLQEVLRESRNRAFTSAIETGSGGGGVVRWVYGFVIRFDNDGYDVYKMVDSIGLGELNDETLRAYWEGGVWEYGGELIENNTSLSELRVSNGCGQIGFSSVSGRMVLSGGVETCEVTVQLKGSSRILQLDSVTGDILVR